MRISRPRLALSAVSGLLVAVIAMGVAALLGYQGDPALDQSATLRARFQPPAGAPLDAPPLRTPPTAPRAPEIQLAAPAPTPEPAVAGAAPAAQEDASASAAAVGDDHEQEHGEDEEHEEEDD